MGVTKKYNIPTMIFINKLDRTNSNKNLVLAEIKNRLYKNIIFISQDLSKEELNNDLIEFISEYDEELLEDYLNDNYAKERWLNKFKELILQNKVFPVFGGSALQDEGILEFISNLDVLSYTQYNKEAPFSGQVYKIRHDNNGNRITFIKALSGSLKVKDELKYGDHINEKINNIRIYNGAKFKAVDTINAGDIFAVLGLSEANAGDGLGENKKRVHYKMIPTMMSKVIFDKSYNIKEILEIFKILNSEDPSLNIYWNEALQEIQVHIMGKIQLEVLKEIVINRFDINIEFGPCKIIYKETISKKTNGAGHFEPLRHYAEVHLKLEPLERNSGVLFENECHADILSIGHQNLIKTHIFERSHRGILTGSSITDIKITLLAGKAHLKHTCGGDFREATYRAIRQGLEKNNNILLEPYYKFKIEVNVDLMGKIISDIQRLSGTFNPVDIRNNKVIITGRGPVATFMNYQMEIVAFTKGKGNINLIFDGYDICHNREEVIENIGYNKNKDIEYTSNSIFCSKGHGYQVPWDKVDNEMHCDLEYYR